MEWLLAILLAGVLVGMPGAWRALAFGLLGPVALVVAIVAIAGTDWGEMKWWLVAFLVVIAFGWVGDTIIDRRRAARGLPPRDVWPYNRIRRQ